MKAKLIERIKETEGFYEFDYSNPEDAACVLESLGGEESLKKNYPFVYKAFLASVEKDREKKKRRSNAEEVSKIGMRIDTMASKKCNDGKMKIEITASGIFADPDYGAENALRGEAPRDWLSGNLFASIYNYKNPAECYFSNTFYFKKADNFQYEYGTEELSSETAGKCATALLLHAVDPNGCLKSYSDSRSSLTGSIDVVERFSIEDPQSRNGNNPIIMLYGRKRSQNESYINADYYNDGSGEYYDNKPQNGKLKTIMPLKGTIKLIEGCTFPAEGVLHKPNEKDPYPFNTLIRSALKVGGVQVSTMYEDLNNEKAYEILAKCFTVDTSGKYPTIHFDLTRDGGHNWYSDTQGVGAWTNNAMTYMLTGGFLLDVIDPDKNPMWIQFSVTSRPIDNMSGKQYYVSNSCQVYVPPVTVHWGCLAKGTLVRLASGQDKKVEDLRKEDQVAASSGKIVTFIESVTGYEDKIFTVRTADRMIKLTGGHPMLLEDGTVKAAGLLKAGDRLMTHEGDGEVLGVLEEDYNDSVYSPIFKESDKDGLFFLCNGFFCGDYNAQNQPAKSENVLTDEQKELVSQFKALMSDLQPW